MSIQEAKVLEEAGQALLYAVFIAPHCAPIRSYMYAVRTFLFVKYEAMNSFAYTKVKLYTKLNVLFSTQFIP